MGETVMLPLACELVVTVVVDVPAVAVMTTDVAFEACQLSRTLCPALIELALAAKVRLGAGELRLELLPLHAQSPHKATRNIPQVIQRTSPVITRCTYHPV